MIHRSWCCVCVGVLAWSLVGCFGGAPADAPSNVASVKGKVLRKGQPFEGVGVTFTPLEVTEGENFNSSSGYTNAQGEYELRLNRSTMGAIIGKHQVRLSRQDGISDEDGQSADPNEVVIPEEIAVHEVTVPAEGLDGGAANFDLDF